MAKKNNRKVVKIPLEIYNNLDKEFPSLSNPKKIEQIYISHIEMKELKTKVGKIGGFLYGKKTWKNMFS